ncbi:hypothetical protein [Vibrio crassostreae]|nr:hypothetical protein [Vibrio crassostreae]
MAKYFDFRELVRSTPDKITLNDGSTIYVKRGEGRANVIAWRMVDI